MALVHHKAVRLDEVEGASPEKVHFHDATALLQQGADGQARPTIAVTVSLVPPSLITSTEERSINGEEKCIVDDFKSDASEESSRALVPLPDNWPHIPQLFRRRSCELTQATLPCINKAVSHLELVQNIIDEWFRQTSSQSMRYALSDKCDPAADGRLTVTTLPPMSQSKSRFSAGSKNHPLNFDTTRLESQGSSSSTVSCNDPLSVQGVGVMVPHPESRPGTFKADGGLDIPYLGAEDVIEEVIILLARLEKDRQEMESRMADEVSRVKLLSGKTQALAIRRLIDLPRLVQQEHEACIMDVNELQWHVAYSSRSEARIQNKTNIAELLNSRLKEDIAFVKKHIPLVQEKLELELSAMDKIRKAQCDTNTELETTLTRQAKTESKAEEAHFKAATERSHIKMELDSIRDALTKITKDLGCARSLHAAYINQIEQTTEKLAHSLKNKQVLNVKLANAKDAEAAQGTTVVDLTTRIAQAELARKRLVIQNEQLDEDLQNQKTKHTHATSTLDSELCDHENSLREVLLKNQEARMESEDTLDKINECERDKVKNEKNAIRIQAEMSRMEQQLDVTMEEYRRVVTFNVSLKRKLDTEEDKAFKMEESLRHTADTLRRQVKDEMHARKVLDARIFADSAELGSSKNDSIQKKDKVHEIRSEVESAVTVVVTKVVRLRSAKEEKEMTKKGMRHTIENMESKFTETKDILENKIANIAPQHKQLRENNIRLTKKLDYMSWQTDLMNKNLEDMEASRNMMTKAWKTTERDIVELTDELAELNLQVGSSQKILSGTRESLTAVMQRNKIMRDNHDSLITARRVVLNKHKVEKNSSLTQNTELATRYRQLQNEFSLLKEKLLGIFEERVKLENSVKDLNQLTSLQMRMHGALMEYFKYRGLYNESEISRLGQESNENGHRVMLLQDDMDLALQAITQFMKSQVEGPASETIKVTMPPSVTKKSVGSRTMTSSISGREKTQLSNSVTALSSMGMLADITATV